MTTARRIKRRPDRVPRHIRQLERAAKRGNSFAQYNLGAHLASGEGVERDLKRAAYWYRRAAAQEEPEAIYNLGLMHVTGEGVVTDLRKGVRLLKRAAALGFPDAQQSLGDVLIAGSYGQQPDPERAVRYYLQSLASGYARSALLLAAALERRGKISRLQLVNALLRFAAESGVKAAQVELRTRRAKGRTERVDPT